LSRVAGRAGRLVIGIGNPSRGDDAVGPLAIERLEALNLPDVELLTDFQLQVEYLLDLEGRQEVVFIDASLVGDGPFTFSPVTAMEDQSFTSHALSPGAVLAAYERHYGRLAPSSFVLAIRAYEFELGEGLCPAAAANLEAALAFLCAPLSGRI
jgi:hydrogenase maturation protease